MGLGKSGAGAEAFLPSRASLTALRDASQGCRGCPLYLNATQAVFGTGGPHAPVMLVGEQPGNEEDRAGLPFVGPAGRILNEGLDAAGIDRDATYVTNVVKHFKWAPRGRRRIHKKPSAREIGACLPWLDREIEFVRPQIVVCLGATAAQALLGREFRVTKNRGTVLSTPFAPHAVATVHPSSILRQQSPEDREREMARFTQDLKVVAGLLADPATAPR